MFVQYIQRVSNWRLDVLQSCYRAPSALAQRSVNAGNSAGRQGGSVRCLNPPALRAEPAGRASAWSIRLPPAGQNPAALLQEDALPTGPTRREGLYRCQYASKCCLPPYGIHATEPIGRVFNSRKDLPMGSGSGLDSRFPAPFRRYGEVNNSTRP